MRESLRDCTRIVITVALAAGFATIMLFERVFPLDAFPAPYGFVNQDCYQSVWNLWFTFQSIVQGTSPLATDSIFYPVGTNLAHHSLAPGFFPFTAIVALASSGSPLYPLYAFKLLPILYGTVALLATYALLRSLGLATGACVIGAAMYSFSRFYVHHLIHPNYLGGFFLPLCALVCVRLYRKPSRGRALLASFTLGASVYFTEVMLYFGVALVCSLAWACSSSTGRDQFALVARRVGLVTTLASIMAFATLVAPYTIAVLRDSILKPTLNESIQYASNALAFVIPSPQATPLYADLFRSLDARMLAGRGVESFLGFATIGLALVGFIVGRSHLVRGCAILAAVCLSLAVGPSLQVLDVDTNVPMPYALLGRIPLFDAGRTPARFVAVASLFVIVMASSGVTWMDARLRHARRRALAATLNAALLLGVLAESYVPRAGSVRFEPPPELERLVPGPVLNLPPREKDGYAALLQTLHGRPIGTGYTARISRERLALVRDLRRIFDKGGADFWRAVRFNGFQNIIVSPRAITAPYTPSMAPLGPAPPGMHVIDLRRDGAGADFECDMLRSPTTERARGVGSRIVLGSEDAGHRLCYGWGDPERGARWSVRGSAAVVLSATRSTPRRIRLRAATFAVPGKIDSQRVDLELNGHPLASMTLDDPRFREYTCAIPEGTWNASAHSGPNSTNLLVFRFPNAESPRALGLDDDRRTLAVLVNWIQVE